MMFDGSHGFHMHRARLGCRVPEGGGGDHIVKDVAGLEATVHVSDRHTIGMDHADLLGAWARLADHAHSLQSMQSTLHSARGLTT